MRRRWGISVRLTAVALACGGCSRSYWRTQADNEVYPAIEERIVSPAYSIGRANVEPDPASRLADPVCPDAIPKPPDDPAAAAFMESPGGRTGSKRWGEFGYADAVEIPTWEAGLGLEPNGKLKLTQEKAVELAFQNSREYQTEVENVYLSALALTLNRFEFATRWFGGVGTTYTHAGTSSVPNESNTLAVTRRKGFNQSFAAGGQLLVDFANSFVWEFTGRSQTAVGNLGVTFLQPLLRNFGRQVRLESLTQAERDTLYSVRNFARFRKQFWAGIAVQGGGSRESSYLSLLLTLQQLRNTRSNLKSQEENLRLHEELFRAGKVSVVEVDRAFQDLQGGRQAVFSAEAGYQAQLDTFKLRLGLPPRVPVEIDDSFLNTFVLVDPKTEALRDEVDLFQKARFAELDALPPAAKLKDHFATLRGLVVRIGGAYDSAESDLKAWAADASGPPKPDSDPDTEARAKRTIEDSRKELPVSRKSLADLQTAIDAARAAAADGAEAAAYDALLKQTQTALGLLDTAMTIQIQAKIHRIQLPEVAVTEADATAYAKEHRLDFQNATARVTDAWRKVTVAANALEGDVTLSASANVASDPAGRNPLAFSAADSRFAVGLQIDGPLNRQAERNAYRASLITYQRTRRGYMELSDGIELAVRNDLRQLALQKVSFEISRLRLVTAVRQLEAARLRILDQKNASGTSTLDILNALQGLLSARNDFVQNFVGYEQQRIQLFLDVEALQLDDRGFPRDLDLFRPARTPGPNAGDAPAEK